MYYCNEIIHEELKEFFGYINCCFCDKKICDNYINSSVKTYLCCKNQEIISDNNKMVCIHCGSVHSYKVVNEWIPEIWKCQKSVHSRRKWFYNKIRLFVASENIDKLVHDFVKVVGTMIKHKLIQKKNISMYNYYIIRLASRIGIPLKHHVRDMKNSKTKRIFDDRLFGEVYKILEWDKDIDCTYYKNWIESKK